jgi:hypothetical protein
MPLLVDEKVIDYLVSNVDGLGKYEISYLDIFPTGIHKLDNYQVEYKNGKYYLSINGTTTDLKANEFIDFNIKEFRNIQLKKLLS